MATIIINIGKLLGLHANQPLKIPAVNDVAYIDNAWLLITDGKIKQWGSGTTWQAAAIAASQIIDAEGGWIMPAFCDSHTHIVFDAWREKEFEDRINGLTYQEIFARGGGILNSVERLRKADEVKLYDDAYQRLYSMMLQGTGAIEIKSGYGLSLESELKMLRVIRKLKNQTPVIIKSTFLGAHAVPVEFKNDMAGYIKHIIDDMLPAIADEGLADFCDVFCEQDY
ncbi:MAG TPA: imidazolonepropionase, partial [Bacteroidia bacterium]|nr:imidazolonepropionase [Bacteroidia bacterium]